LAMGGPSGYYPYPVDAKGEPVDTPDWRNCDNIKDCASEKDIDIIKAVRTFAEDPAPFEAAVAGGADINSVDRFGFTPLMLAIKSKNPVLIEKCLAVEGVKLDVQTRRGFSALMIAAWKGDNDTIMKLIKAGATLNLKENGGRNAWGIAHDWHKEETLELLDKNGLNYKSMGGTATSFPPAPKWRMDEKWD